MTARRAFVRILAGVLLAPSFAAAGDRFLLDGKPFVPDAIRLASDAGDIVPGDVIAVAGLWMTLAEAPEYRFRTAPEGVLLEQPDGSTRWVGARVGHQYVGDEYLPVDGLAALTEPQVRGLWGLSAETWNRSCVRKARWLDPERTFVSLGQTASEGREELPILPAGLRRLEANRLVGFRHLASLRQLEYLDVLPEDELDLCVLAGMERLRVLRIVGGKVRHAEALGGLRALERLDLRHHQEVTSVAFARSLSGLREVGLEWTGVSDLTPLGGLPRLRSIRADGAPVDRLPDGPMPALEDLDVMLTRASDADVAAFRRAHPGARVRRGWNQALRDSLGRVTHAAIRSEPGCGGEETAPRDVRDPAAVEELLGLLAFEELEGVAICGCFGGTVIDLHRDDGGRESLRLVCGLGIRWEGWPGDGELPEANQEALAQWLARHGDPGPLAERRATEARLAGWRRLRARATAGMSDALRQAFERDVESTQQVPFAPGFRDFEARLEAEVLAPAERIRMLLRVLGADVGSWSGLGGEEQVATSLLTRYPRTALERACSEALLGDDRQARRGAARFWDGWQSPIERSLLRRFPAVRSPILSVLQESRSPDVRQQGLSHLLDWWAALPAREREDRLTAGLLDPHPSVRRRAIEVAGQARGAFAEPLLRRIQAGDEVEIRALPPVPAEEEDVGEDASAAEVARGVSDADLACRALASLRPKP